MMNLTDPTNPTAPTGDDGDDGRVAISPERLASLIPGLQAQPNPLIPEPAARRRHPAIRGTPVSMGGRQWLLAFDPPTLGPVWDRLYDDNVLAGVYNPHDVWMAAGRLLDANYDLPPDDLVALVTSTSPRDLIPAIERALLGPADGHRTYTRWVAGSLLANGLAPDAIPPDRLADVLEILVRTGRTVPEASFVSSMDAVRRRKAIADTFD